MKYEEVQSSGITHIGYDAEKKTLGIKFGAREYHYKDVPPEIHTQLLSAPSKGKFYIQEIQKKFEMAKQGVENGKDGKGREVVPGVSGVAQSPDVPEGTKGTGEGTAEKTR
jgi:hypothetical protein